MKKKFTHKVPYDYCANERISDYAIGIFPVLPTKNSVKKAIKKQILSVDNQPCTTALIVKKKQVIEYISKESPKKKIFKLKLEILYEDDFMAVINKPAGFSVSGNKFKTIENALPFNLKKSEIEDALQHPLPAHRLDMQTSGLLIAAKTKNARIILGKQFENNEIKKTYFAVVIGKIPKYGEISVLVDGKQAFTKFELVKTEPSLRNGFLSLIKLFPKTGRTHQLRIHCEAIGFPILGDKLYNGNLKAFKGKGLFLSASGLVFNHPVTNKLLNLSINCPNKFKTVIEREKKRFELNAGK